MDDRMTGLSTSGNSQSASYTYAYNGDRLQRTLNGVSWTYLYNREDILKVSYASGDPMYLTQGPGIDDVLAETTGSNTSYAYKNMLSSVGAMTNGSSVTQFYRYDAWGQASIWPNPTLGNNPYGYTGRERDTAGAYYYRERIFLPHLGRFASGDPSVNEMQFQYVDNRPLFFRDPFGLQAALPYPGAPASDADKYCPSGKGTCYSLRSTTGWYVINKKDWDDPWKFAFFHEEDAFGWAGQSSSIVRTLVCFWNKTHHHWRSYEKEDSRIILCLCKCPLFVNIAHEKHYEHKEKSWSETETKDVNRGFKWVGEPKLECLEHPPSE